MSSDSSDVESWEGMPLELEPPAGGVPLGEETISRPIEELVPSGPAVLSAPLLARWMLLCASAALAFSLASVGLSLLEADGAAPWQGGLLALDCAVVILVLRAYLVHGTPVRTVCHWVLSLGGLAAAAFVIQAAVLRSAAHIIAWPPPPAEALTALFASGLLGLAGIIVFAECLERRSWACRSAAAAGVAFLALLLVQAFSRVGVLRRVPTAWAGAPGPFWPGLAVATLGAVAFVAGWQKRRTGARAWAWQLLAAGGLLLMLVAAAAGVGGGADGAGRAWRVAALWEAAALLPLALPGVVMAWRQPEPLRRDVLEATQFLWVLVALGVVAMVGVWLPTHLSVDLLHMGLVGAGMTALVTGAWLGAKRGDWAGRWVLLPTGALTILVLCALGELHAFTQRLYPSGSALWAAAVMLTWCTLAVGLVFATAGLAVKRQRARERLHGRLLRRDARLVCGLGAGIGAAGLSVLLALWAGEPAVGDSVRGALVAAGALAGDLLALAGGAWVRDAALRAADAVAGVCAGGTGTATGAGLLAVALAVHVAALWRARWALHTVGVLWSVPLAACSLLAALCAVRLVLPWGAFEPATGAGGYLAASLGARIVLLGLTAALLVRLWESLRAAFELSHQEAPEAAARADQPTAPQEQDMAFVVRVGLLVGSVGLGVALLLLQGGTVGATLSQLGLIAGDWLRAAGTLTSGVGRLSAEWTGYAAAAAVIAIVLVAVHDEALRGRVAVYPLLGLVWTLMVGVLALGWGLQASATSLPATPGRVPALAVTGLVLLLLAAATVTVWVRWWRLRQRATGIGEELLDRADPIGAAHSLGSVGLVLVLGASAAVAHAALASDPRMQPALAWLAQAAVGVQDWLALSVETARTRLMVYGTLGMAVGLLALASLVVLTLHLASQRRRGGARVVLFALWSGGALAGAGVGAYLLLQVTPGQWSGARVAAAILLVGLMVRALVALGSLGRWAGLRGNVH